MKLGQIYAQAPASPCPTITVCERVGTDSGGRATWRVVCTCGATFTAHSRLISGGIRCPQCNPRGIEQAREFLALLPATYAKLQRKLKLKAYQVDYRIRWMREREMCFVGDWERAERQGAYAPVVYAGKGEDVPCNLKPIPKEKVRRNHEKRVKRAVKAALAGGKEDPRYMRHIALHKATQTVKRARIEPQNPFSALFTGSRA